jgi:putative addiction module component (TIGR02574 family)
MSMTIEHLTDEVMSLPSEARALLADRLVESLDPAEDGVIHRLWVTEVRRRQSELESGAVSGISAEDVMARLRKKYA